MTTGVGTFGNSVLVLGTRAEQKDRCHCRETGTRQNQPAPSRSQVEVDTVNESVARIEAIIGRKVETRQKGQLFPMTQGTPVNVCRNRWLILIFNISGRRISVLRDVCEESTFCCVSASARQVHRYCYLHLLSSFTRSAAPRTHIYPFVQ